MLLGDRVVRILACVLRADYLTLRCHNATITQDVPIIVDLCLGSNGLLARLTGWQSVMDRAPLATII